MKMETIEVPPTPQPSQPVEQPQELHRAQTYQDDVAKVMNATEAPIVQELLNDAREQEIFEAQAVVETRERKWYGTTALILIILTIGVILVGSYEYLHLTVPVHPATSVGVFQNTDNIVATTTTIDQVITNLSTSTTIVIGKPTLVNLVTDAQTNTLLSDTQLFAFMQAAVPEPLQSTISTARLGVLNTGTAVVPFIIASVPDPAKASQEFSNAEPTLLQLFSKPLGIDLNTYKNDEGQPFQSQYFYNLPVRTLSDTTTVAGQQSLLFLYGYANNNIIVITTKPEVLKAVYDTIVNQVN